MATILPLTPGLNHYTFQVELDDATYGFEFWWNYQASAWVMSIMTADDTPIVTGIRVVVDWPLAKRYPDARLPPGMLVAQDTSGAQSDPQFEDLGARVQILYFSEAELANG